MKEFFGKALTVMFSCYVAFAWFLIGVIMLPFVVVEYLWEQSLKVIGRRLE